MPTMTHAEYMTALQDEARDWNAGLLTHAQYASNVRGIVAAWREQREADEQDRYTDACGATFSDADSGL